MRAVRLANPKSITISGQGFYVHDFSLLLKGNITLQRALDDLTGLAQQGTNHIQAYSMELLPDDHLAKVVAHCESHGIFFGFSLVEDVALVM